MTNNELEKAIDICEKLDFFCGQRAGRELWFEKPVDVQDRDIKQFVEDVAFLKDFINRQKAKIERLKKELIEQQLKNNLLYETAKEARTEAIKEFAERLKTKRGLYGEIWESDIDKTVEEMTEETQ